MIGGRAVVTIVMSVLLVLAQVQVSGARGCSMCGASCRCTSHGSSESCAVRSVGCGGGDSGTASGPVNSLRFVIEPPIEFVPPIDSVDVRALDLRLPEQPPRAPLDHPPRVSC